MPIIVFYCDGCREPLTDRKILDGVVELFAEHSADIWYERTAAELMPAGHDVLEVRRHGSSRKENDILDVWFDSGSSHLAVLGHSHELPWPADMYLEGGDQYRGWFHSSLLVGVGLRGGAPYRECATNGWTLDGEGRAMSKSLGNIDRAGEDHQAVRRRGPAAVGRVGRVQRRRAPLRHDSCAADAKPIASCGTRSATRSATCRISIPRADARAGGGDARDRPVDPVSRPKSWSAKCRAWYDEFAFHKVYRAVYDFATIDLSAVYFDISRTGCTRRRRSRRRAAARRRRSTGSTTRWCGCWRRCWPSPPKKFGATCAAGGRAGQRASGLFPEPERADRRADRAAASASPNWDR